MTWLLFGLIIFIAAFQHHIILVLKELENEIKELKNK